MKSVPGSDRATPLHGHVKLVPSMRNWFSFVPDPNADIVVTVPLDGDVGDTPGAALTESNMLARREGIVRRSSGQKRTSTPGFLASTREMVPSTTTDAAIAAGISTAVRSTVAPAPMRMSPSRKTANRAARTSRTYRPGASATKRKWPLSSVLVVLVPPIKAGD